MKDTVKSVQYPVWDLDYTDDTKEESTKQLKEKEEIVNVSSDEVEDLDHNNGETE